jgi:hypothetical protein
MKLRFYIFLFLIIALTVISCESSVITQAPIPTNISTPTFTSVPTSTLPPTALPILTSTATLTPFPLLSPDDSITRFVNLLSDNGGCKLPCLLGLNPQSTTPAQAIQFFTQFGYSNTTEVQISTSQYPDLIGISIYFIKRNLQFNGGISAKLNDNHDGILFFAMDSTTGLHVVWSSHYVDAMKYYMLPQILSNYGKPSKF